MGRWKPLLLAVVAMAAPAPALLLAADSPAATAADGVLVRVGGHALYLRCVGPPDSRPTVVLEAGGGGTSASWAAVQDLVAPRVRSCAYDRAGVGKSEGGPQPRTMAQEVLELHALLDAAGVRRPLVLVGHSIGGLLVRLYADRYGEEVAGVVLVEPTHEDATLYLVGLGRWARVREQSKGRTVPAPRLESSPSAGSDPAEDYLPEELQRIHDLRRREPQPLGDRPLVVLGAGKRPAPPGTAEELWQGLRRERDEQVADLAGLSRNSKLVVDPASGHDVPREDPQLVVRSIEEVLEAVSRGTRLAP